MENLRVQQESPARCRLCLKTGKIARLTQRDLAAFYTMFRPCGLGQNFSDSEMSGWVCSYCWMCASQFINFVQRALSSELELTRARIQSDLQNPGSEEPALTSWIKSERIPKSSKSVSTQTTDVLETADDRFTENNNGFEDEKPEKPRMELQHDHLDASHDFDDGMKIEPNSTDESDVDRSLEEVEIESLKVKLRTKTIREELKELEKEKLRTLHIEQLSFSLQDMLEEIRMKKTTQAYLNRKFKCELCGVAYNEEETYENHVMRSHHRSVGEHECEVCMYRFDSLSLLRQHVTLHSRRWRCLDCGDLLVARSQCVTHHERCGAGPQAHNCHLCDKTFSTAMRLKIHVRRIHHMQKEKRFICDICGKSFFYKYQMRIHIRSHLNIKPFECETCGKKFTTLALQKNHRKTHVPRVALEDRYCVECDRYFGGPLQLKLHLTGSLSHVTKDTFRHACIECPDRFKALSQLQLHINTVHLNNRTHPCPMCDKAYYTKGALKAHTKNKHTQEERRRDHVCAFCGKAFLTGVNLKNHVVGVHRKERPYACDICGATFGYKAALYTHNKLKHKMKSQRADTAANRARYAHRP